MVMAFPLIETAGRPYEMGYQHGRQAASLIRATYERFCRHDVGSGAARRDLREKIEATVGRLRPQALEEMRGIADGAGIAYGQIRELNFSIELWSDTFLLPPAARGCTLVGLKGATNGWLIGKTVDVTLVQPGRKAARVLGRQRPTGVSPFERLGQGAIEIGDEVQDALLQVVHRGEVATLQQTPHQNAEPELDLVQPRSVDRRVHEPDGVHRVLQEGGARLHGFQDAGFALDPQVYGQVTALGDQANQGFRLMDVQLIYDEDPCSARIVSERLGDMCRKVFFGTRRAERGGEDATEGDLEVGDQRQGAVAEVFVLAAFDPSGRHG